MFAIFTRAKNLNVRATEKVHPASSGHHSTYDIFSLVGLFLGLPFWYRFCSFPFLSKTFTSLGSEMSLLSGLEVAR